MKRVGLLAGFALCLAPSLAHAFPFYQFLHVLPGPPATDATRERVARPSRPITGVDYVLSIFDDMTVAKFREAWQHAGNGTAPYESVILILKMADGGYSARMPNPTHEYKRFTFAWHPATVAIIHTHPDGSPPRPEEDDIKVANKYNVPVFTLTKQGMFVYDPATRKITKVLDGLDWMEERAWQKIHVQLARG